MIANRFNPLGVRPKTQAMRYIQDGLIAMWDGIENVGWGTHDANATVWTDLIGGTVGDLTLANGYIIENKYIHKSDYGDLFYKDKLSLPNVTTVEVCAQVTEFNPDVGDVYHFPVLLGFSLDGQDIQFGWKSWATLCTYRVGDVARVVYSGGGMQNSPFEVQTFSAIDNGDNTARLSVCGVSIDIKPFSTRRKKNLIRTRGYRNGTSPKANYFCIRIYNRALTDAEVAHNYAIDKERFGL